MIFSKELDKSLYLILKFDKKNRMDIVRLISSFPFDFYNSILNMLNDDTKEKEEFKDNNSYITLHCLVDKSSNPSLTIRMTDNRLSDELELCLSSSNLDNEYLGYFLKSISKYSSKKRKTVKKEKLYKYSRMSLPTEELFIKIEDYKKIVPGIPMIRDYKDEKIPKELTLRYLDDKFNKKKKN